MTLGGLASVDPGFALAVLKSGCDPDVRDAIGPQLASHPDARKTPAFEKFAQKAQGGGLVAPRLNENVKKISVRNGRAP